MKVTNCRFFGGTPVQGVGQIQHVGVGPTTAFTENSIVSQIQF